MEGGGVVDALRAKALEALGWVAPFMVEAISLVEGRCYLDSN